MTMYKFIVHDRNYNNWEIVENTNFQKVNLTMTNPIQYKLFSNDVFTYNNSSVNIEHSSIRNNTDIPGVLIIHGNKTYGRTKKGKLLYKCIPDDCRLPPFLVPYEIKHVGFSKVFLNLYVTFSVLEWDDKHPYGVLNKVIGSVDTLDNFYEYQLYCKSLNASIQKFQKNVSKALERTTHEKFIEGIKQKYPSIEDRTIQPQYSHIFTIDSANSTDLDDGFSIYNLDNDVQKISIYISNVSIWMDILNIWDSFSRRISTIYLPDKKRPMLPTILSDCLCSLLSNVTRIAFYMDIYVQHETVIDIQYGNAFIKVSNNYQYEHPKLLNNRDYIQLLSVSQELNKTYKYTNSVKNSHDLVSYLMIFMNCHCANKLLEHNTGIFRSTILKTKFNVPTNVPEEVATFITIWSNSFGQYIDKSSIDTTSTRHDLLNMDAYIHITSPIRRLVDLLNMIKFQETTKITTFSEKAHLFYDNWLKELDYINTTMRSIRKIQTDCNLLELCYNNPSVIETEYNGYVFDKISRSDGLFQYIVYLPELKLSSRITTRDDLENFELKKVKLFIFNDESRFKQKIRLHILS